MPVIKLEQQIKTGKVKAFMNSRNLYDNHTFKTLSPMQDFLSFASHINQALDVLKKKIVHPLKH